MAALPRFEAPLDRIPASPPSTVRWLGRRHHLRWSVSADDDDLALDLVDVWSGEVVRASVPTPGWVRAEDEVVLRDYALARVLADAGIIEPRFVSLAIGRLHVVIGRLTAASRDELAAGESDSLAAY